MYCVLILHNYRKYVTTKIITTTIIQILFVVLLSFSNITRAILIFLSSKNNDFTQFKYSHLVLITKIT